jgi:primary-amine oxidase
VNASLILHSRAYNILLELQDFHWKVYSLEQLPEGTQPQITVEEIINAEEIVRNDPQVIELAAKVGEY